MELSTDFLSLFLEPTLETSAQYLTILDEAERELVLSIKEHNVAVGSLIEEKIKTELRSFLVQPRAVQAPFEECLSQKILHLDHEVLRAYYNSNSVEVREHLLDPAFFALISLVSKLPDENLKNKIRINVHLSLSKTKEGEGSINYLQPSMLWNGLPLNVQASRICFEFPNFSLDCYSPIFFPKLSFMWLRTPNGQRPYIWSGTLAKAIREPSSDFS